MKAQIVSFHCVLKDCMGRTLSSTFNQDVITQIDGSSKQLLSGLVKGLENLRKGESRRIFLSADQAYGFYEPELVLKVSKRKMFRNESLQMGSEIQIRANDGEIRTFRVTGINGDQLTLDGNHPLAGQDLEFDIMATEARDATVQELEDSSPMTAPRPRLH